MSHASRAWPNSCSISQEARPQRGRALVVAPRAGILFLLAQPLQLGFLLAQRRRHGVDIDPQLGRGLVDQIDRLIGQKAVGDIAAGKPRRRLDRLVGDRQRVMLLVALAQAKQHLDRRLDIRLLHKHRAEAPLQRGILLDMLAILVDRRRADHLHLAAR